MANLIANPDYWGGLPDDSEWGYVSGLWWNNESGKFIGSTGEGGYGMGLMYSGDEVTPEDTLDFYLDITTYSPDQNDGYVAFFDSAFTLLHLEPVLPDTVQTINVAGSDVLGLMYVAIVSDPYDTVPFGGCPWAAEYSIYAAEGAPSAVCFWTDLVGVTQECGEAPPSGCPEIELMNGGIWGSTLQASVPQWGGGSFDLVFDHGSYYFQDQGDGQYYPTNEYPPCPGGEDPPYPWEGVMQWGDGGSSTCIILQTNGCA